MGAVGDLRKLRSTAMDGYYIERAEAHYLQVADDGFVIAMDDGSCEEHRDEIQKNLASGTWVSCRATDCLNECTAAACSCTRTLNPTARDGFLRYIVRRIAEVSAGREEISYASLGSGLLRFDFELLEALLREKLPVTAVHLVDPMYRGGESVAGANQHRAALAQFAAWFSPDIQVYAHNHLDELAFHVRQNSCLPTAVVQVDCSELTWVFEDKVKPQLEEVLLYGGLFCALTAREGSSAVAARGCTDAWGEIWRLCPDRGRLKNIARLRFRPGDLEGKVLAEDEALPPVLGHDAIAFSV